MIFRKMLVPGALLAPVRRLDAADLFAAVDANRDHLREWLPWIDMHRTPDDSLVFLEEALRQWGENGAMTCSLRWKGRIVGVIGFHRIDWTNRSTKLGYWLAEEMEGQGLMSRAAASMVTHAFEELGLHRIEIRAATGNQRSQAIPRRLGFWHEGTAREAEWLYDHWVDLEVFAMTEPEWVDPYCA